MLFGLTGGYTLTKAKVGEYVLNDNWPDSRLPPSVFGQAASFSFSSLASPAVFGALFPNSLCYAGGTATCLYNITSHE